MGVFIRIPASAIIAGNYKVGLTPREKVAVSLPELVQQTNAFSMKHRPGCEATLTKSDPKELYLQYNVKCHNEDYNDPNGHEVRVKFDVEKIKEGQRANDLDIQASCSCEAFLYWGAQWNLHQRDGLLGEPRPLLQAPTQRLDLRNNFVICKHCKVVFERILPAIQHNINNLLRKKEVEERKKQKELEKEKPVEMPAEPTLEDAEALEDEAEQMLEDQGVIQREEPATEEERRKHPKEEPRRYQKWIDKLKERVKGWKPEKPFSVPTPEPTKKEEKPKEEPLIKETVPKPPHAKTPHVDTGLPYIPKWRRTIDKLKQRIKQWGKK